VAFPASHFAGWVATLVVAALTAAAFTAQGIYAPSRSLDQQRYSTATYLTSTAWSVAQAINDVSCKSWLAVIWAHLLHLVMCLHRDAAASDPAWAPDLLPTGSPACSHVAPAPRLTQPATRDAVLAQIMALPNWNASSPDWKPLLYLGDGVAAQQAALQGFGAPVCGATPAGTVQC